jgi:hypothetical protein
MSTEETLKILKSMLLKNNDAQVTQQIITLMKLVLSQNYFIFENKIYESEKGVPLGSPISSIIAEIFLQHFEDIHIKKLLDTESIIFYRRYANHILIIYDTQRKQPGRIKTYINQMHKGIKLNPTYENNRSINFLDLLVIRKESNIEIDIFRKPTTTETTINFFSNHPKEYKSAAFRYDITRMHSLPLTPERKEKELELIQQIAQHNNFPQKHLRNLNSEIHNKQDEMNKGKNKKTSTTFTYYSPIVREITDLFQHTNVGISFKYTNTLQQLTKPKIVSSTLDQDKIGIYKLTCNTCKMSYIGQTRRSLKERYDEHIRDIKHKIPESAFAKHIRNRKHEYGPTINDTMTLLKHIKDTTLLTPYEQLYIQSYSHNSQLIPEQQKFKDNPMYQLIHDVISTTLTDQYSNSSTT